MRDLIPAFGGWMQSLLPILREFQANTTVLTGNLLESETMGTRLNRRQRRLHSSDKMPVEIFVGTNDPAGIQEEFGNRRQAARPALRPAWDRFGGATALRTIAASLRGEIERQARLEARAIKRRKN